MTTITALTLNLDADWVDQILVTAFDGLYGGSWYWVNECDDVTTASVHEHGEQPDLLAEARLTLTADSAAWEAPWRDDTLDAGRIDGHPVARLRGVHLSWACSLILSDPHLARTETGRQLGEAIAALDETPDLDAEACDVIVQVALFGQIIYG